MPGVYVLKLGPLTFAFSLSGWRDRTAAGRSNFELLARREPVGAEELLSVYECLRDGAAATDAELAQATGLSVEQCRAATGYLLQSGRVWPDDSSSPLAASARRIVESGNARLTARRPVESGWKLTGSARGEDGRRWRPLLHIDRAGRIIEATCTCPHYRKGQPHQVPCEHVLALRLNHMQSATSN
jgi:hypothetical protein